MTKASGSSLNATSIDGAGTIFYKIAILCLLSLSFPTILI